MTTHWHVYTPVWDVLDLRLASAPDRFQLVRLPMAPAAGSRSAPRNRAHNNWSPQKMYSGR